LEAENQKTDNAMSNRKRPHDKDNNGSQNTTQKTKYWAKTWSLL